MIRVSRALLAPALLVALLLSACTQTSTAPEPTPAAVTATAAPGAAPASPTVAPVDPDGTAKGNLPAFEAAAGAVVAADADAQGRALVDALVAVGFPKDRMEVTADATPLGNAVDSILVAVHMPDACLIGQRARDGFSAHVEPALSSGRCLVGQTRMIDW
ncbi:DUF6993 domain-containing protein [Clavibacter sepedonicus]|uniref:Lipoprotein n=1 Tax=Clavibacter sepedonicus TaxID=31964 RepID=B0RBB5_CLASE|nr:MULTISPECIES: hypothetical protein [Clavibacter]MBD5380998.1 hypothetical protein [Clavibacter sp.]OQJ47344.1 hypothetical protein B5P19_02905 [Clavibacter sepedonicus]OQJ52900.1 hypothetical protein B5P20_01165 [Clavibacter sepedonicus]UUK66899.1 hypothetical protein LRE50_06770 [Clavibacter sepedonicus]CAQ01656.1 putative lipoprotein [Clavibacter sepedonicus]